MGTVYCSVEEVPEKWLTGRSESVWLTMGGNFNLSASSVPGTVVAAAREIVFHPRRRPPQSGYCRTPPGADRVGTALYELQGFDLVELHGKDGGNDLYRIEQSVIGDVEKISITAEDRLVFLSPK